MPPQPPNPPNEAGSLVQPGSGLARLPGGDSPALAEIIARSLLHIQTSKALALRQRSAGEECEFEIAPGVKLVMCWIPPGEFLMGRPADEVGRRDYEKQHRVRITRGFWLAKTQTSQAQWEALMGSNPSYFKGKDLPVEQVSWKDICGDDSANEGFLGKLNRHLPTGEKFHLPTEAQWEFACRAGTTGTYAGNLDEMGWYDDNSDDRTHPVGKKKPNAWGLHDMHGNVCEWCADWYGVYPESAATDPTGPNIGSGRAYRGGSWNINGGYCRSADRFRYAPNGRSSGVGFRVAAVPGGS